jgi:predicted TIM-barrel fold metal-dependent hydrolase
MIIDMHTHPWMENCHIFHPDEAPLLDAMDEHNIDTSILLSMNIPENEQCAQMAREHPGRYIPFYWVELGLGIMPALRKLEEDAKTLGVKGLKLYPHFAHIAADDLRMYPVYAKAAELGLVCLWHMGDVGLIEDREDRFGDMRYSASPITIARIATDFPELKIVMAHLGGNFYYQAMTAVERHANIYMDTAWLHYYVEREPGWPEPVRLIEQAVAAVGAERIVYGGEGVWPEDILGADLTDEQKTAILGGNAAQLLGL